MGLLQAKAYRVLKKQTADALAEYRVSTVEWALLGLLFQEDKGMRSSKLAKELGVEAPFITALFRKLEKRGFVDAISDENDSRARNIRLTDEGIDFVQSTEQKMKQRMRPLIEGISVNDLMSYVAVLEKILQNNHTKHEQ